MSPNPEGAAATTFERTTMVNRRHEAGFCGTTTETAECNMVFVDTSIDTHLAMLVYKTDTVLDFKEKIALEHMHCFPKIEDIQIHSLKVKREASFYHLPDSMLVWSVLHSAKGNWVLSVDASSSSTCHLNQNSLELDLTKCTALNARNVDSSCRGLSSDINRTQETIPVSLENNTDIKNSNLTGKKQKKTKSRAKKKRKMSHTELGQDVRADQSGAVPFKKPDISATSMDPQETSLNVLETDMRTGKKKRKKKKSKKPANNLLQVSTDDTVVSEKREPAEENQHSSGNGHGNVEKEKETFTTEDVQEDLPVTDQKNDIGIHKASSQLPSLQSEEKLEEKHEISVETDEINFTDYFVPRVTEEINFRDYFVRKSNVSSMSDHPMSGRDQSQEITRKGSSGAKGQSTAGKGTPKLDSLSDSEEMVLRSSKRIKKANLLA